MSEPPFKTDMVGVCWHCGGRLLAGHACDSSASPVAEHKTAGHQGSDSPSSSGADAQNDSERLESSASGGVEGHAQRDGQSQPPNVEMALGEPGRHTTQGGSRAPAGVESGPLTPIEATIADFLKTPDMYYAKVQAGHRLVLAGRDGVSKVIVYPGSIADYGSDDPPQAPLTQGLPESSSQSPPERHRQDKGKDACTDKPGCPQPGLCADAGECLFTHGSVGAPPAPPVAERQQDDAPVGWVEGYRLARCIESKMEFFKTIERQRKVIEAASRWRAETSSDGWPLLQVRPGPHGLTSKVGELVASFDAARRELGEDGK